MPDYCASDLALASLRPTGGENTPGHSAARSGEPGAMGHAWFRSGAWLAVVVLTFSLAPCARPADAAPEDSKRVLTVSPVVPASLDWGISIPASGWFAPWHEAVVASEVDGLKIAEVLVEVGDVVRKGQVLARLNPDTVLAERRRLEATVSGATTDHEKAQANAGRSRVLEGAGVLTTQLSEEYQFTEASASAALAAAQAMLDFQRLKLEQTQILAIDDGIISARAARLGSVVATGTELFRIIRQQRVEWQAEVSSRQINLVKEGQAAWVTTRDGERLAGRVRALDPAVNKETGRALVYVDIDPPAHPMAGIYASGTIVLGSARALTVPESALVLRDGFTYVFSLGTGGRVTRIRVDTGRRQDGRVEILQGLDSTTPVVRSGGAFLSDGAVVAVVAEAGKTEGGK